MSSQGDSESALARPANTDRREKQKSRGKRKGDGQWIRVSQACARCRKMKIRCDEGRPCQHCQKSSQHCVSESVTEAMTGKPARQERTPVQGTVFNNVFATPTSTSSDRSPYARHAEPSFRLQTADTTSSTGESMSTSDQRTSRSLSIRSEESGKTHMSTASSAIQLINESVERRYTGQSSYAATSEMIPNLEKMLRMSQLKAGLPGTDDPPAETGETPSPEYISPMSIGYPDQEKTFAWINKFLYGTHCIFSFVHGELCRRFISEMFHNGVGKIDAANRAAHMAMLALGCQSSLPLPEADDRTVQACYEETERLYTASRVLGVTVEQPSIPTIALLVATCLYQLTTRRFSSAWTTFGTCARQAQAIGLHRDTPDWDMSPLLREGRRSTWVNIYTLDTYFSVCYGRPPAIIDDHCDSQLPSLALNDMELTELPQDPDASSSRSIVTVSEAPPSRLQFHLLKYHLCRIIRRIMNIIYLAPGKPESRGGRQTWDALQSAMEDLTEFRACMPAHLRVEGVDKQPNPTYKQQTVFLDILINHTILLANRPMMSNLRTSETISKSVAESRQRACKDESYRAACAIAAMVEPGRDMYLSLTVQLVLSAFGIYTSAAEIIALHAINAPTSSQDAYDAYRALSRLLRHFGRLRRYRPYANQEYAILRHLVQVVVKKANVGSANFDDHDDDIASEMADQEHTAKIPKYEPNPAESPYPTYQQQSAPIPTVEVPMAVDGPYPHESVDWSLYSTFLSQGQGMEHLHPNFGHAPNTDMTYNEFGYSQWSYPMDNNPHMEL